ncbi:MAG: hypothetical protein J7513_17860 [Solirubrobacteraceae bacterium]|nr:hypothetical protein [Solirubrobacteraceae bacterium]
MFGSRTSTNHDTVDRKDGPSLARGPAWIVGLLLAGFGLAMFFQSPGTPLSTANFPDGSAIGDTFLGIETNAWTAWGTTAAGVLVLMGAAQHALAKTMSLLAGLALGAAAILALIDGDVLGLAAANTWTIVGWGAAAGILLVTALLPRVGRRTATDERDLVAEGNRAHAPEHDIPGSASRGVGDDTAAAQSAGGSVVPPATTSAPGVTDGVAPGQARSTPLQRTYRENTVSDAELEAARRAHNEEAARRQ